MSMPDLCRNNNRPRCDRLDGTVLHGIEHLQSGYDLARGEYLNPELVFGDFSDPLGDVPARLERIKRLGQLAVNKQFGLGM